MAGEGLGSQGFVDQVGEDQEVVHLGVGPLALGLEQPDIEPVDSLVLEQGFTDPPLRADLPDRSQNKPNIPRKVSHIWSARHSPPEQSKTIRTAVPAIARPRLSLGMSSFETIREVVLDLDRVINVSVSVSVSVVGVRNLWPDDYFGGLGLSIIGG